VPRLSQTALCGSAAHSVVTILCHYPIADSTTTIIIIALWSCSHSDLRTVLNFHRPSSMPPYGIKRRTRDPKHDPLRNPWRPITSLGHWPYLRSAGLPFAFHESIFTCSSFVYPSCNTVVCILAPAKRCPSLRATKRSLFQAWVVRRSAHSP